MYDQEHNVNNLSQRGSVAPSPSAEISTSRVHGGCRSETTVRASQVQLPVPTYLNLWKMIAAASAS